MKDIKLPIKYLRNCTNTKCYFSLNEWLSFKDLSDFQNESENPFLRAGEIAASAISFDNTVSGVTTDNVQAAIDELYSNRKLKIFVDNYSELTLEVGMAVGDVAYVYNSQGTSWLPSTLGGTYYPEGWYIYSGTSWVSNRNDIAAAIDQLQTNYLR